MTTIPNISYIPGTDKAAEGYSAEDPSGLKQALSAGKIDDLFQIAKEQMVQIVEGADRMAPGVSEAFHYPDTIEFYAMGNNRRQEAKAAFLQRIPKVEVRGIGTKKVTASIPCSNKGNELSLRLSEESFSPANLDDLRKSVTHELLHLVTKNGVSPFMKSRVEALNDPLLRSIVGEDEGTGTITDQQKFNWDPNRLHCTDGLAEPDFGDARFDLRIHQFIYALAPLAFDGIEDAKVWQIWKRLLEKAKETGRFPYANDIKTAVEAVLQEQSAQVLNNPCFVPMQRDGLSVIAMESKDNRCATAVPIYKEKDPKFGYDAQGNFSTNCYTVYSAPNRIPYTQIAHKRSGPQKLIEGSLGAQEQISYYSFVRRMESDNQQSILDFLKQNRVRRFTYNIQGISPIEVHQHDQDPWIESNE